MENEFLAKFREMIINDYGVKIRSIISRGPQAQAILERVHQRIGNILCTFIVQNIVMGDKNLWDIILVSTMFIIRATVHTNAQYTPAQLVFGHNSITN